MKVGVVDMWISDRKITTWIRALVLGAGCVVWWNGESVDKWLEIVWLELKENWIFKLDSFEPLLVTITFLFSMLFYHILDEQIPRSASRWKIHKKNMVTFSWKKDIKSRLGEEVLWYWIPLVLFDVIYPRRKLTQLPPTYKTLFFETIAALIVYDILFFIFHIMFHKISFFYKQFHAKHHTTKDMKASEAIRLTLVEEVIDVACSITSLNLLRCHPFSRALYNIIIVYLITELHSGVFASLYPHKGFALGYDMPWMLQNVVPFELWGGSRRHDFHHRYGTKYFSKFFTPLDSCYEYCLTFFSH